MPTYRFGTFIESPLLGVTRRRVSPCGRCFIPGLCEAINLEINEI